MGYLGRTHKERTEEDSSMSVSEEFRIEYVYPYLINVGRTEWTKDYPTVEAATRAMSNQTEGYGKIVTIQSRTVTKSEWATIESHPEARIKPEETLEEKASRERHELMREADEAAKVAALEARERVLSKSGAPKD